MASIVIAGDVSGACTIAAPSAAGTPTLTLPTTSGTLVVTGGAQTVQFAAGSAASPSITFTGDTNTGIFSPAADTIGFSEGGVESMRIASDGNIGVGTSTTTNGRFTIAGYTTSSANADIRVERTGVASTSIGNGACLQLQNTTSSKGVIIQGSDDVTQFFNNGGSGWNERMRIDSSGNVGIGTSSPGSFNAAADNLVVGTTSGNNGITIAGGTTGFSSIYMADGTTGNEAYRGYIEYRHSDDAMALGTAASERVRITSGGDLLVGTTSWSSGSNGISLGNNSNSRILVTNSADFGLEIYGATTNRIGFAASNSASRVGSITVNTTNTAYNTSSDYRLKENIAPMTGALEKVALLKPCTYTWKVDGSQGEGFIAHELAEVVPQAVTGEKDGVDKDGNPDYQAIDVSFLVATLTAAIQELNAKVEAQAAEIAALKGAN